MSKIGKHNRDSLQNDNAEREENVPNIMEHMLENIKDIKSCYDLNKEQAKQSFWLAVVMSALGVVFMVVFVLIALFRAEKMTVAILAIVCAVIVEITAGIALMLYKKSLEQLGSYFDSLRNSERLLSIISIVDKVSLENRDDIY